jgi:hypothetical protein
MVEVAALATSRDHAAAGDDHVHSTPNEIGPQGRQTIVLTFSPPVFHRHVLALDVAGL